MRNTTQSSGGIGFVGLLVIVLIVLKLTGLASISWLWVFSPIFIALGVVLLVVLGIIIFAVVEIFMKNRRIRRR